jgi:hypothetical protein
VERVHVECNDQSLGANAFGSDHNLLYVDWKLHVDVPECGMSATRTIWKMSNFEDAKARRKYQQALSANLKYWRSTCNPLLLHPGTEAQRNSNELDISYHLLVETIQTSLAETISVKTVGPDQRSYWDASLQELIEQRTKAYREAKEKYIMATPLSQNTNESMSTCAKKCMRMRVGKKRHAINAF